LSSKGGILRGVASFIWGGSAWQGKTKYKGAALYKYLKREHGLTDAHIDDVRTYLKFQYAATQRALANENVKEIVLYRGFYAPPGFSSSKTSMWAGSLSSFSSSKYTASGFGDTLIRTSIPRARILGTYRHGLGDDGEKEHVVMGDSKSLKFKVVSKHD